MTVNRRNKKGTFPLLITGLDLNKPHILIYNTLDGENPFTVVWNPETGGINCVRVGNALKAIFEEHQLGQGQIFVEHYDPVYDDDFKAGKYTVVNKVPSVLKLTNDVTDDAVQLEDMPSTYIHYSSWTEEEKDDFARRVAALIGTIVEEDVFKIENGELITNLPITIVDGEILTEDLSLYIENGIIYQT